MLVNSIELSERELEILRLVATGASNKEIARQLYISPNTVKVHLRNIFAKIEVNSRTEAAMYAVSAGLVSSGPQANTEQNVESLLDSSELHYSGKTALVRRLGVNWRLFGMFVFLAILVLGIAFYFWWRLESRLVYEAPLGNEPARWQVLTPMPTARYGQATAVYENMIYVISGENGEGIVNVVERYNPETDIWEVLMSKPTGIADVSAAVIGGKIYVPGGRLSSGQITDVLEIYDPRLDAWTQGASLPIGLSTYGLAVFEGSLYLFGGWDGKQYVDTVYEYKPLQDIWVVRASLPSARGYAGTAVAGRKIFVIGGQNERRSINRNDIYQPDLDDGRNNPWSRGKPIPAGRWRMSVVGIAEIVLVFGGVEDRNQTPPTLEYLPQLDEWQIFDRLGSQSWTDMGCVPLGANVYIVGGRVDGRPVDWILSYQTIYTLAIPIITK